MELFSQEPDTAKAVGTLSTVGALNQILTGNTATTIDQLTALVTIDGPRRVGAEGTTLTVSNVSTAVAIGAIFTEGAERTVRAARRLEGLGVWSL